MATNASTPTRTRTEKGVSLARGPALILGTILEVAGLYFLYKQHGFPKLSNFPNGDAPVPGKVFLGIFGVNGWSGLFTAAAGGLLLFGAAQHLLAKTMSLIVGVALGAAAVIAVISGNVLGLAAANAWTRLGWAACAVILLFNTLIPRRKRTIEEPVAAQQPVARNRMARSAPAAEPVTRTQAIESEEPVTRVQATESEPVTHARATESEEPVTRAQFAETEPLVTRQAEANGDGTDSQHLATEQDAEGESTGARRVGPMDDRDHVQQSVGDPAQSDLPSE